MRYASRISSFKSRGLALASRRSFHQSPEFGVETKKHQNVVKTTDARGSADTSHALLASRSLERQRKDRLLEDLIRKSAQVSLKSRFINNTMPRNFEVHKSGNKTRSHIQFITTPTADTPGTALLLHFDDKRYVIGNIHEGVQRAGLQIGARFFRAKDFFLTGKTEWRSNGGLLGMILTLADATKASALSKAEHAKLRYERQLAREEEVRQNPKKSGKKGRQGSDQHGPRLNAAKISEEDPTVNLHGGPNLTHTIATARSFIFRHGTPIKVNENHEEKDTRAAEQDGQPTWEDGYIQVWAMPISPSSGEGLSPGTPRKRSLDEYMSGQDQQLADADDQWSPNPKSPANEEDRNQQIREFVVSEMFSSSWRADNLIETPLHEVVMPAGLFIRNPHTRKIEKYTGPVPDGTTPLPDIKVLVRQPWPGALVDHLPPTKPSTVAMSYIIRNHKQRGKFKPEAAKALKVPPGPLWSTLARGSEVQSSDGKTITPDMVLEPSKDGVGVAIVDLPSKEYIQALVNRPEWNTDKVMTGVGGIIWILGPGLSHDPTLREFIESKTDLKHIISSTDHCPNYLVQTSAATAAIRHHQIDPIRFPIPVHSNATHVPLNPPGVQAEQRSQQLFAAKRGLRIDLEPSFGVREHEVVPYLNTAAVVQETPENVVSLAQTAQKEIKSSLMQAETANQDLPSEDAEIICLGTGSAVPSPFRNVAGTLLRVPGHGSYLLDCGEDTLGQLKRIFTESELAEVFHDLKVIWISHLHADHHLGTTSVIRAWYEEVHGKDPAKRQRPSLTEALLNPAKFLEEGKRLFIVGHGHMMRWLEEYSSVEDFGYNQLIPLTSFPAYWKNPSRCNLQWNGLNVGFNTSKDPRVQIAIRKATSLSNLVTVAVAHCYGAQAVTLTFPNGFKFSYSGDCRPSRDLAIIGKGSTVLLHEATFDDELAGDAEAKKHSTTSEAIGVGVAMGAKRVLLTHFSQRYQKVPSMGSMRVVGVKLEDAEEVEDPMEVMEPPVNTEDEPLLESRTTAAIPKEDSDQEKVHNMGSEDAEPQSRNTTSRDPTFASLQSMENLIRPSTHDMKIGVAFDYMRVRVGDIMHLEKFTPALRELYKDVEKEETDEKARKAAKEAFSDDKKDVSLPKSKGPGTATKEVEGTKAGTAISYSERKKEKKRIYKDNNQGNAVREGLSRPAGSTATAKTDAPSPPTNEIQAAATQREETACKHLNSDRSIEPSPADAATSETAAAGVSASIEAAPNTPAADGPASTV